MFTHNYSCQLATWKYIICLIFNHRLHLCEHNYITDRAELASCQAPLYINYYTCIQVVKKFHRNQNQVYRNRSRPIKTLHAHGTSYLIKLPISSTKAAPVITIIIHVHSLIPRPNITLVRGLVSTYFSILTI